jgi:glutamyl/glutaminyl-tRNA synthetase
VAWHNWDLARATGGKFVVIVDDLMYRVSRLWQQSYSLDNSIKQIRDDIEWLGLTPYHLVRSLDNEAEHISAAERLGYLPIGSPTCYRIHMVPPADRMAAGHAYHSYLVTARVMDDHLLNVGGFVRGDDLVGEMQLYDDISRRLGLNPAGQTYIPIVRREEVPGKESKSDPRYFTLAGLREAGYTGADVILTLRECAARSVEDGKGCVFVPDGLLETPQRRTLRFYDREMAGALNDVADKPWRSDVVKAIDQYQQEFARAGEWA